MSTTGLRFAEVHDSYHDPILSFGLEELLIRSGAKHWEVFLPK